MLESGRNWELFGYDMRNFGRHWMAAWRDLLSSYDSPIRRHLDEAVLLRSPAGEQIYHAGEPSGAGHAKCTAALLPDELVLIRSLRVPSSVEAELDSVLQLEVNARSPFGLDDTASGWRVVDRGEHDLEVMLAIVSKSAAMTYIAQQFGSHDANAQEVWAEVGGKVIVVEGFGEDRREALYRRRLARVSVMIVSAFVLLLLSAGLAAGVKKLELGRLEELSARIEREAAVASQYRATLGRGNETIAVLNELTGLYPSPHPELARLTGLLGDDAFIERFTMRGQEIDLRGRAVNAAVMMQSLSEQDDYTEVSAVSPIRRIPNSEAEQFHLKIKLGGEA